MFRQNEHFVQAIVTPTEERTDHVWFLITTFSVVAVARYDNNQFHYTLRSLPREPWIREEVRKVMNT
jgi:hypothetical protein